MTSKLAGSFVAGFGRQLTVDKHANDNRVDHRIWLPKRLRSATTLILNTRRGMRDFLSFRELKPALRFLVRGTSFQAHGKMSAGWR